MNKIVLEYINRCESWKTAIKSLHWASKNMSQHKLCDDIAEAISSFQDQVSEVEQGIHGKIGLNKLSPKKYTVVSLNKFVKDVIRVSMTFLKKMRKEGDEYIGMCSDIESFISVMQRQLYLVNFTVNEQRTKQIIGNVIREYIERETQFVI
jgi:hypothetical protein